MNYSSKPKCGVLPSSQQYRPYYNLFLVDDIMYFGQDQSTIKDNIISELIALLIVVLGRNALFP